MSVLNFSTSPNSGVKLLGGFLRSEKSIFRFISSGGASFSWYFIFLLLRSRDAVSYSAGHFEEMQNKNLGGFMPLIHVLWYLDKYLLGSGYSDAVVVVDDTPAMAAKIAMSDLRTKVAFLALSTIKQKDLGNAVGGALQHAIIMRYMLEADQTVQGATAAP